MFWKLENVAFKNLELVLLVG